jgi:hypothetical protein
MRFRRGRTLALSLAALAASAIGASVFRNDFGVRRFGYNIHPLPESEFAALASGDYTTRTLKVDDVVLRGLERIPHSPDAQFVLFFTGNEAHPLETGKKFLEALRAENDWGGQVWAYRGFDGSGGAPSPDALYADAWLEYSNLLAERHLDRRRVHVVGFSLGTTLAASVAARAAENAPASLTLLSPASRLDMLPDSWFIRHRYETLKYLDAIQAPVLVIHGTRDNVLPVDQGRTVAQKLASRATYVERPELSHLDLPDSPAVLSIVRSFIEKH